MDDRSLSSHVILHLFDHHVKVLAGKMICCNLHQGMPEAHGWNNRPLVHIVCLRFAAKAIHVDVVVFESLAILALQSQDTSGSWYTAHVVSGPQSYPAYLHCHWWSLINELQAHPECQNRTLKLLRRMSFWLKTDLKRSPGVAISS